MVGLLEKKIPILFGVSGSKVKVQGVINVNTVYAQYLTKICYGPEA